MIEPIGYTLRFLVLASRGYSFAKLSHVVYSGFINELDSDFQSI